MNNSESNKKKMLMLGTSYCSSEMVLFAKKHGWYTIVTDPNPPEKSKAKLIADEYWMINTGDIDKIEQKCREEGIGAILCGISEFNLEVTMELCRRLDLPCYCTPEAWHFSKDKADFKELCNKTGVPVPKDYFLSTPPKKDELDNIDYPVMVKPVDLSANRGISYCYNPDDVIKAIDYAHSKSKNPKIVIEKMIKGKEWWAGYALADGEIRLLSLNGMYSQPGMPKNCYSITTTITDHVEEFINDINPTIIKLLENVGCKEGYAWVQLMRDEDGKFYVIEMGYRLTGEQLFNAYRDAFNFDVIDWITSYALGRKNTKEMLPKSQSRAFKNCALAYTIWTSKKGIIGSIDGLEEISKIPGVSVEVLSQTGDEEEAYSILGNIVFARNDIEEICSTISLINKLLSIKDTAGNDMIIKYTDYETLRLAYKNGIDHK